MPCLLNWQCFHTALQDLDDASMACFRMYGPRQQSDVWARTAAWLVGLAGSVLLWAWPGQGSMPGGAVIS